MSQKIRSDIRDYALSIGIRLDAETGLTGNTSITDDLTDDSYDYYLKFDFSPWPSLFPRVYDAGQALAWNATNHIYGDGMLCFETEAKQRQLIKTNEVGSLDSFHKHVLQPHLAKQFDFANGDKVAFQDKERPHNMAGIIQGYAEILGVTPNQAACILKAFTPSPFMKKLTIGWNPDRCYCGSGLTEEVCKRHHMYLNYVVGYRQVLTNTSGGR